MDTTIIFDMGNVILPFDPMKACRALSPIVRKKPEDILETIYNSKLEYDFEAGRIDGTEFTRRFNELMDADINEPVLKEIWSDMFVENPEISQMVRVLKLKAQLLVMSNTNEWHFQRALDNHPVLHEFEHHVVSYKVGTLKPHPKIYETALEYCRYPDNAVFIDDIEANVLAAEKHGIKGIYFLNASQLESALTQIGI